MPLVLAICPQCGAHIEVDDTREAEVCKNCGTAFVTEKAINNYNMTINNSFDGANMAIQVDSEFEREYKAVEALHKLNQDKGAEQRVYSLVYKYPHEARAWLLCAKVTEKFLYEWLDTYPGENMLEANDSFIPSKAIRFAFELGDEDIRKEIEMMQERYLSALKKKQIELSSSQVTTKTNTAQGSSHCYVATCVYGSYDCPQVWTLRRFRDDSLEKTLCGRIFIKVYYAIGPFLIKSFGDIQWIKNIWKKILDKMVLALNRKGFDNSPYRDRTS